MKKSVRQILTVILIFTFLLGAGIGPALAQQQVKVNINKASVDCVWLNRKPLRLMGASGVQKGAGHPVHPLVIYVPLASSEHIYLW